MPITLESLAEKQAQQAEKLAAFGSLNVLHIKRQLAELLKLIGRNGLFDEYTQHDISHVDKMLNMLNWLIPQESRDIMSPTDWLLTVLGIYFHDIGMLVTREEFSRRAESGFPAFVDEVLFAGDSGDEYRHKVGALEGEEKDRFLYQEFVRYHHAERARWWIMGEAPSRLGITSTAATEIDSLLAPLRPQFRRDLGFVAESHHLDDLDDLDKYRVSQPYGDSDAETGNLLYAAVILRATDLLHITADRTPAIAFRTINPVDPLSQQEWAKQMAVTRVRAKVGCDVDGNPDPSAPRDTVEVHAFFRKEDGFFGLTSYLSYAAQQLAKCHDWIEVAVRRKIAPHEFPWSRLDDSNIETDGFIRDAFQFTIDQAKVLDLLTGHTLYNDTSVVIRELVQNALDAIRLRLYELPESSPGIVKIAWNSNSRMLSITDNGTGMTQETISNHLLRVGASLYQDPSFKKSHPGFASISRFGIGVLSTFMIADSVEIITCHPEEPQARRLALRSVHGRYLISLLDKGSEVVSQIGHHGTILNLRVRKTVEEIDFLNVARHWILVPDSRVEVSINGAKPIPVGFSTPKEALVHHLKKAGHRVVEETKDIGLGSEEFPVCVIQQQCEGVTLAYAVRWAPYFHEWSFMPAPGPSDSLNFLPIGTCVEGVRVDGNTPGFMGIGIFALANAKGENSPKTNVARSGLEATPERDALLTAVYKGYLKHIEDEIQNLRQRRGHSLTWAIQEAHYLMAPLSHVGHEYLRTNSRKRPQNSSLLLDAIGDVRLHLIEENRIRKSLSTNDLQKLPKFWTITCSLHHSAEALIRETPGNASIGSVFAALDSEVSFPEEPILCRNKQFGLSFDWMAFKGREISCISANKDARRVDILWEHVGASSRWLSIPDLWNKLFNRISMEFSRRYRPEVRSRETFDVKILRTGVDIAGFDHETAFRFGGTTYFISETPAIKYAKELLERDLGKEYHEDRQPAIIGLLLLFDFILGTRLKDSELEKFTHQIWGHILNETPFLEQVRDHWGQILRDENLINAIVMSEWRVLDPKAWERRFDFDVWH